MLKLEHKVVHTNVYVHKAWRDYREGNGPGERSRSSRKGQNTGLKVVAAESGAKGRDSATVIVGGR